MSRGMKFEDEVRRLARARWILSGLNGGSEFINHQEIDSVCRTEELTHLLMCTIERKLDKVREDVDKLLKARDFLQRQHETVKLWEITKHEPTADQRACARAAGVEILSIESFQSRLINPELYFPARRNHSFGSAVDPTTGSTRLDENEYVPLPIRSITGPEKQSVSSLSRMLESRKVITLLGNFGSGKSLTVREVFYALEQRYNNASHKLIPLAINLREHWGQTSIPEILMRHANGLAYERPNDLVRIWNADAAILLLDGFDELAAQPLVSGYRMRRAARRSATQIVREFVADARGRVGVLLTGRGHYFDSLEELRDSCGLFPDDPIFELEPFGEAEASDYLGRKGITTGVPDWLPRTPLLLGYLATGHLLEEVAGLPRRETPALAWDAFLSLIAQRDAKLSHDIDAATIRQLLERLATRTRREQEINEIDEGDLTEAFREVTGYAAVDATNVLLQRLPGLHSAGATLGLTPRIGSEGRRSFADPRMREALEASDLVRFLHSPFSAFASFTIQRPLTPFGCEVAAELSQRAHVQPQQHVVAAGEAANRHRDPTLALDCLLAGSERADVEVLDCKGLIIQDAYADEVDASRLRLGNLTLRLCAVDVLSLYGEPPAGFVLERPFLSRIDGASSRDGLPSWVREPEEAIKFDAAESNAELMGRESIPLPVRVLLTIIRKLFVQRGSGRVESALRRGIDLGCRDFVSPILTRLASEGVIFRTSHGTVVVWHPTARFRARMLHILDAPMASGDELVESVAKLK
jgi:hypothetical protein